MWYTPGHIPHVVIESIWIWIQIAFKDINKDVNPFVVAIDTFNVPFYVWTFMIYIGKVPYHKISRPLEA